MSESIPFFTAVETNRIEQYRRFFHTKAYIGRKSPFLATKFALDEKTKNTLKIFMKELGFSKMDKFLRLKSDWDNLLRPIPLKYFDLCGIHRETLRFTLDLDMEAYENTLRIPLYPRFVTLRFCAGVYAGKPVPEGFTEEETIEYMSDVLKIGETRIRFCINYPELKTVFIEPDGSRSVVYYPPVLRFGKTFAVPAGNGQGIGTVRI